MSRHSSALAAGRGLLVLALGLVAACTAGPDRRAAPAPVDSATSAVVSGTPDAARSCRSLVGRPFYTAMSGGGVTCSFGLETSSTEIRVIARRCPDSSPFYEFYSTDPSAGTDRSRYFGSQVSPLFQADAGSTIAQLAARSCVRSSG